jgi:hypothetical protein
MRVKPPFRILKTKHTWNLYSLRIGVDPWGTFIQHGHTQTIIFNRCGTYDGDWRF